METRDLKCVECGQRCDGKCRQEGSGGHCGAQHHDGSGAEHADHACRGCGRYVCADHCYDGGLCVTCATKVIEHA